MPRPEKALGAAEKRRRRRRRRGNIILRDTLNIQSIVREDYLNLHVERTTDDDGTTKRNDVKRRRRRREKKETRYSDIYPSMTR